MAGRHPPSRAVAYLPAIALAACLGWSPPATAGDAAAGRDKARQCQACHGIDGLARMPNVPHLAGESEQYLAEQLRAFRSGEREDPQMGVIAQDLSDTDIADLAAWYAAIEVSVELPETASSDEN